MVSFDTLGHPIIESDGPIEIWSAIATGPNVATQLGTALAAGLPKNPGYGTPAQLVGPPVADSHGIWISYDWPSTGTIFLEHGTPQYVISNMAAVPAGTQLAGGCS